MAKGRVLLGNEKKVDDFRLVDDEKLRLSLNLMADKISEREREAVYLHYNDPRLIKLYSDIRRSGIYKYGSKDKSRRKILDVPTRVWDFLDTVMGALYGSEWFTNKTALKHELVRPWWVVDKL